jgi:ATP-binding cassette, subfamily C, bacterial
MARNDNARGLAEIMAARAGSNGTLMAVLVFSTFVNLLLLTGPLYMLQVYDRVLGSQSEATLVALSVLVAFLFLAMGFLDHARGRIMARIGARIQDTLDRRVFSASVRRLTVAPGDPAALAAQRDLESIQRLWGSPVLLAIFDIPWTPLFIGAIFIFHPWMGWLAVAGGVLLIVVTLLNQGMTEQPLGRANAATMQADRYAENLKAESEIVTALGMSGNGFDRWQKARGLALRQSIAAADLGGAFSGITKTFRMFLQSAMLGLGAWLVLKGELTAGAMIAGSILMGRALAPIEQSIGQWALVTRAREGRDRLAELLTRMPEEPVRTALPRPRAILEAQNLTVLPPGEQQAVLRMVSFRLEPGQALGVIGPSGSGKSSLARALIGVWRAAGGKVRLDGQLYRLSAAAGQPV